ncbi:MAG: hypothetical protein ACI8ZM_000864 [Crocinitomix sp.]|jgi:hypothetical protein
MAEVYDENPTQKIISNRQLSSRMNNTKWKKLLHSLKANPNFNPDVNIKFLDETHNKGKFSPVWWSEVEEIGFVRIEWLEIRTYTEENQGRLIEPKRIDYSEFIILCLKSASIDYFQENDVIRVNAYI